MNEPSEGSNNSNQINSQNNYKYDQYGFVLVNTIEDLLYDRFNNNMENDYNDINNKKDKKYNGNWAQCAEILQERTGKQCAERWRNCLNEGIRKGEWTAEENLLVLKLYDKFKSYKKIAIVFPGRTENSLKNRMFIQLRKVALKNNKKSVSKIKLDELKLYFDEAVRKAEETYFNRNKDATFEKFEEYLKEIENIVEKAQNQKEGSIYLNDLRDKIIKNNYDSDSFSGVYEDEQKKVREIEKIEKKELKKEKARIQRRANYEKQKQKKIRKKK